MDILRIMAIATIACSCAGCETQSQMHVATAAPAQTGPISIRLEACRDRTANTGRDLGAEATEAMRAGLSGAKAFVTRDDARLVVSCEVTRFEEGSAFARWLMPGAGSTTAQLAVMVSNSGDGTPLVIVQGDAVVAAGGFFTIGADRYILKGAVDDVVAKLTAWAEGRAVPGR